MRPLMIVDQYTCWNHTLIIDSCKLVYVEKGVQSRLMKTEGICSQTPASSMNRVLFFSRGGINEGVIFCERN
jgi:hypothetical protein